MKYESTTAAPLTTAQQDERFEKKVSKIPDRHFEYPEYPKLAVQSLGEMKLSVLQSNLGKCLNMINDEVMKGYLTTLDSAQIAPIDDSRLANNDIQFFKIAELVYEQNEFFADKLSTVFSSLSVRPCTAALMIKSDGVTNSFYFGVRALESNRNTGTKRALFENAFKGQFPGSRIEQYSNDDLPKDMEKINADSITAVTCVADYKREKNSLKNQEFIQGLEKFVYSMQGRKFTAVFIADSVGYEELMARKREYEDIYTQLSPFANMQFNFSDSSSESESSGQNSGVTYGTSKGVTGSVSENYGHSSGQTDGTSHSHGVTDTYGVNESSAEGKTHTVGSSETEGTNISDSHTEGSSVSRTEGTTFNVGIPGTPLSMGRSSSVSRSHHSSDTHTVGTSKSSTESISDAVSKTLSSGTSRSYADSDTVGTNSSTTKTDNYGRTVQSGTNYSVSDSFNLVNSQSLTNSFGSTKGIALNAENMTIKSILDRIKKHLERFDECESMGMWNFAAYFLGESPADTETAANTYYALMSGNRSGIERSAVNTWTNDNGYDMETLQKYIKNFIHPVFIYNRHSYDGDESVGISPAALVSSNELALHLSLPRHSVKGLPVMEHSVFGQEVVQTGNDKNSDDRKLHLGKIFHLGEENKNVDVKLDINSLAMHTFITGSTGSGKSNAVFHILNELKYNGVKFLAIEPAKGEYGKFFIEVNYYGTNLADGNILHINPFSFPENVDILEHIEKLTEIFGACWPLYAAMPAVLKDSIVSAYVSAGWDMDTSQNTKLPGLFPTFDDVLRELDRIIKNSDYSKDTKGDYIGSLSTRIKSLTNGINGRIFSYTAIDDEILFDKNTVVDISKVGSMETKALIMGFIILKLQEYRQANTKEMNVPLRHVTVLEEAHNLLRKTSTDQSQESSNVQGKSVEMLTNSIAEMRAYGEGFIIADQAPDLLDTAVIRNTNTKIVHRLPEQGDREITGCSMALRKDQITELSKLPTGVAAVYQNDWQEAVLCRLPYENRIRDVKREPGFVGREENKNATALHMLIKDRLTEDECKELKSILMELNVSAKIRRDIISNMNTKNRIYEWAVADFICKCFKCDDVFKGTQGTWQNLAELADIMSGNISQEFEGFSEKELKKILYYICRTMHERHPKNELIEKLRVEYLKKEVMI